jgi:predicted GNAT family acetyltransferase
MDIEYFVSGRQRDIWNECDTREELCVVLLQDNLFVKKKEEAKHARESANERPWRDLT